MSYSQGGLISASDFNGIANGTTGANIAWVWGTGYGTTGYGQSTSALASLASGATVSAAQWSGMLGVLNNCLGHQHSSTYQLGPLNYTAGQTITYFANVLTAATGINVSGNISAYSATGAGVTASFSANPSVGAGAAYNNADVVTRTVTFASAAQARYFFNAGGSIKFSCYTTTSSTSNAETTSVVGMVNALGNLTINNSVYTTLSTALATKVGNDAGSGAYTADYSNVRVATNSVNSSGAGDYGYIITIKLGINTTAHSSFNSGWNITIPHSIVVTPPETTYLSNVWGVFGQT